jgi:hypothetical protein
MRARRDAAISSGASSAMKWPQVAGAGSGLLTLGPVSGHLDELAAALRA